MVIILTHLPLYEQYVPIPIYYSTQQFFYLNLISYHYILISLDLRFYYNYQLIFVFFLYVQFLIYELYNLILIGFLLVICEGRRLRGYAA